jgi:hypothetical protein
MSGMEVTKVCGDRRRKSVSSWFRLATFVAWTGMCAASCGCLLPHAGLRMSDQSSQALVSRYSSVFQPGAKRADVEDYFRANKTPFRQLCCVDKETTAFADLVQIGRNHDGWPFCSGWTVNIAFVFSGIGKGLLHPDPTDVLKTIELAEVPDGCL